MKKRLSYKSQSRSGYGLQRRRSSWSAGRKGRVVQRRQEETRQAQKNFESRSKKSQAQDLIKLAPLAPNIEVYLRMPDRFDWRGVDYPDPKLISSHKTKREQAADIADIAGKAPVEVWIKEKLKQDISNVEIPGDTQQPMVSTKTRKFKVIKKEEVEAEKERKEVKTEEPLKPEQQPKPKERKKRTLPTKAEILARATEKYLEEQARQGLPTITPEENELKEAGLFEEARAELMRSESIEVDAMVLQYIDSLRSELEPMGFGILPLAEM